MPGRSLLPDLTIRPSRARDGEAISRVLSRSYGRLLVPDYPDAVLRKALPLIGRANPALVGRPTYFVAVLDGAIAGVGGWTAASPQAGAGGAVGHVRHVACDPDHVRKGVMRALMAEVLGTARAAGVELMCCLSTRTAVPFYASLGFEGAAEVEVRLAPGVFLPSVEMRMTLR